MLLYVVAWLLHEWLRELLYVVVCGRKNVAYVVTCYCRMLVVVILLQGVNCCCIVAWVLVVVVLLHMLLYCCKLLLVVVLLHMLLYCCRMHSMRPSKQRAQQISRENKVEQWRRDGWKSELWDDKR